MAQPFSSHGIMAARRPLAWAALQWGGVAMATTVLLVALALWLHYGTTVFFEMIAAGFAACF